MNHVVEILDVRELLWTLFVAIGTLLFFGRRIALTLRSRENASGRKTLPFLLSDEYLRSDFWGALVGGAGFVFVLILLVWRAVANS